MGLIINYYIKILVILKSKLYIIIVDFIYNSVNIINIISFLQPYSLIYPPYPFIVILIFLLILIWLNPVFVVLPPLLLDLIILHLLVLVELAILLNQLFQFNHHLQSFILMAYKLMLHLMAMVTKAYPSISPYEVLMFFNLI